jgi:hypothetical protein
MQDEKALTGNYAEVDLLQIQKYCVCFVWKIGGGIHFLSSNIISNCNLLRIVPLSLI